MSIANKIKTVKVVTLDDICEGEDESLQELSDAISESEVSYGSNKQKTLISLEFLKEFFDGVEDEVKAGYIKSDFDPNGTIRAKILALTDDVMIQID